MFGEPAERRSVSLSPRHWEAIALLGSLTDSSASQVLAALVEAAVAEAAAMVEEIDEVR